MPRKDLQQFIQERLTALDPLLDVSAGSRADTEVIKPLLDYFGADLFSTPIRQFLLDTINRAYPELGVKQDGVIDDTSAKPVSAMLDPIVREIGILQRRQLVDPRVHTLDSARLLAGALFLPIVDGGRANGTGRLYYVAPVAEVVRPENVLYARNGMRFTPTSTQTIMKEEMQLNLESGLYYFDVRVVAVDAGTAGNIDIGTLDRAPSVSRAVRVTNKLKFSGGTDGDTVETIFARAAVYPTQLSLSVARGIRAIIDREFEGLAKRVEVVGMGDPLMLRDVIKGGGYGPPILFGSHGQFRPSVSPELASDLFQDVNIDFSFLGSGVLSEDYYLFMHRYGIPGIYRIARIAEVLGKYGLRLDTFDVPLANYIGWSIHRKIVTLSDVPGGIAFPTTADGEIEIRDDEVHVGGMTDAYVHETLEETSTDLEAASDEEGLASGADANLGGGSTWFSGREQWVRLDDFADRTIFDTVFVGNVLDPFNHPGQTGFVVSAIRDFADVSAVRVKPGYIGSKEQEIFKQSWHSDILSMVFDDTLEHRFRLTDITTQLVGPSWVYVFWTERLIPGPANPTPGQPLKIVRPLPDGIEPGRHMLAMLETGSGDKYYRIIDWATGWYNSSETDTTNYRGEVRIIPEAPPFTPAGERWIIVDDIDVNLVEPKRLRVTGTQLATVSGSANVTDIGGTNFESYGVVAEDVLRFTNGLLAGKEYTIKADPFGPGKTSLTISTPLDVSGTFKYEIFAPQTPIEKPLSDITAASLLASGSPSTILPYGKPLGASSSQFSNASSGLKWRTPLCYTGMVARTRLPAAGVLDFNDPNNKWIDFEVYSLQWGYYHVHFDANGLGGSYDLAVAADRQRFLVDLNAGLPIRYFVYLKEDGSVDDGGSTDPLYFAVQCFDSDEGQLMIPGAKLTVHGASPIYNIIENLPFLPVEVELTSRTVSMSKWPTGSSFETGTISGWNDLILVETGLNAGKGQILMGDSDDWGSCRSYRLFGGVRMLPQILVTARAGAPSTGYGRTFFRDPTLAEFGRDFMDRFTTEDDRVYMPDPRLYYNLCPGYPETENPEGMKLDIALKRILLPDNAWVYDIMPGDWIMPTYRRFWCSGHDFALGPWTPATPQTFVFNFEDGPTITVLVPGNGVTQYVLSGAVFPQVNLLDLFNEEFGETIAEQIVVVTAVPPGTFLGFHTQKHIKSVSGNGFTTIGLYPITALGFGNLSAAALNGSPFIVSAIGPAVAIQAFFRDQNPTTADPDDEALVQFRVIRLGQRFSAKKLSENQHANGLYYADVDLISLGTGNEWNIGPNLPLRITGGKYLGYYVEPDNEVLSLSTAEKPWLRISPWVEDPATTDEWASQVRVYGQPFRIAYKRGALVASLQALADSEDERENNESFLARCMLPCQLYVGIQYYGGPTESTVIDAVKDLIERQSSAFDVSEIIALLMRLGATKVVTPIELAAAYMAQDRSPLLKVGQDRVEVTRTAGFTTGRLVVRRLG